MVVLTSFAPPEEGVVHTQDATEVHMKQGVIGKGTLYIAESRVSWRGENGQGFSLEYPGISLHAISRDLSAYPRPCLYLMLDSNIDEAGDESNDSEGSDSSDQPSEVRFIPDDALALDNMYKAMCDCQALHPDEEDDSEDEEGEYISPEQQEGQGDFYTNEEDVHNLTEHGQQTLQRLEQMFRLAGDDVAENGHAQNGDMEPEDQFADADDGDMQS